MIEGCNHRLSVLWPMQNEVNVTAQFPVEQAPLSWEALEEEEWKPAVLGWE